MDPTQKEAQAGVRGALGKAYEQQLRAEADAVAPDKLSKRKHQINSLYYAAKMKVRFCAKSSSACVYRRR